MESKSPLRAPWDASASPWEVGVGEGQVLPPHQPTCMGCGPDAAAGYHLQAVRRGDEVVAEFTFSAQHAGGPGLAHGGAVAALCDDLLGHVLTLIEVPGVTRRLEVDYLAPVVIGDRHQLVARLVERGGRKMWIECEGSHEGVIRFRARALMVRVDARHFLANLPPEERARAEEHLAAHGNEDEVTAP
jgi:acyl-coenzyme A thioesterase PaaI-like protein